MKRPHLHDDAFLADVAEARLAAGTSDSILHFWWLGQSGFLVQWRGRHFLLDPYLSDSLTRKYAGTDKPHIRMTRRVIAPERLDFIEIVTSSHNHTDHLDPETLQPLVRVNPGLVLVCPEANRAIVQERSGLPQERIVGIDPRIHDGSTTVPNGPALSPIRFHPIPAAHESIEYDEHHHLLALGLVLELGPFRLYHSGDTVRYDGMAERLRPYEVNVALLPINGRAPQRRVAGNLSGLEAAQLARDIRARLVVPCHYDMFEFNTATPDEFEQECHRLEQPCRTLQQGERLTLKAE